MSTPLPYIRARHWSLAEPPGKERSVPPTTADRSGCGRNDLRESPPTASATFGVRLWNRRIPDPDSAMCAQLQAESSPTDSASLPLRDADGESRTEGPPSSGPRRRRPHRSRLQSHRSIQHSSLRCHRAPGSDPAHPPDAESRAGPRGVLAGGRLGHPVRQPAIGTLGPRRVPGRAATGRRLAAAPGLRSHGPRRRYAERRRVSRELVRRPARLSEGGESHQRRARRWSRR